MTTTISANALGAALDDILDIIRETIDWPHGDCSTCTDRFTICNTCKSWQRQIFGVIFVFVFLVAFGIGMILRGIVTKRDSK